MRPGPGRALLTVMQESGLKNSNSDGSPRTIQTTPNIIGGPARPDEIPAGVGVGLRTSHYTHLVNRPQTEVEWFEIISENFMDTEGRPLWMLDIIRSDYPVAMHGVSLNIGSARGVNLDYLARLKKLTDRLAPFIISDHVCWTGVPGAGTHNLLPLPYNQESLQIMTENIERVQETLGREIALENPSSYLLFNNSDMSEYEFIAEAAQRSGCGLLLDINNVYVSCTNHGMDPRAYIDAIPRDSIRQVHLAGYSDQGEYLFDTHSAPVFDAVWELYEYFIERGPNVPVLVEWDEDIPAFELLEAEAVKARRLKEKFQSVAPSD